MLSIRWWFSAPVAAYKIAFRWNPRPNSSSSSVESSLDCLSDWMIRWLFRSSSIFTTRFWRLYFFLACCWLSADEKHRSFCCERAQENRIERAATSSELAPRVVVSIAHQAPQLQLCCSHRVLHELDFLAVGRSLFAPFVVLPNRFRRVDGASAWNQQ